MLRGDGGYVLFRSFVQTLSGVVVVVDGRQCRLQIRLRKFKICLLA